MNWKNYYLKLCSKGISLTVATTSEFSSSDIPLSKAANIGLRGFVVFNF